VFVAQADWQRTYTARAGSGRCKPRRKVGRALDLRCTATKIAIWQQPTPDACQMFPGHEYTVSNLSFAAWVEPANAALQVGLRRKQTVGTPREHAAVLAAHSRQHGKAKPTTIPPDSTQP
jgi:hypothetical protein